MKYKQYENYEPYSDVILITKDLEEIIAFDIRDKNYFGYSICKLSFLDYYNVQKVNDHEEKMTKLGDYYNYNIIGKYHDGILYSCGLIFEVKELREFYDYISDNDIISVDVDRIDVEFNY